MKGAGSKRQGVVRSNAASSVRAGGLHNLALLLTLGAGPWLLTACGASAPPAQAFAEQRLAQARKLSAAERAPDLWSAAQAAGSRADSSVGAAAADARSEARLWLEAAIVESERVRLAEERLAVEREIEGLLAAAVRDDRARRALHTEATRQAAASAAREQARVALERAATDRRRRPKLAAADVKKAARALLLRARLVLAALVHMEAKPAQVDRVQKAIDAADARLDRDPEQALTLADQALFAAHAEFGPLRARLAAPTEPERKSLSQALRSTGASLQRAERGLSSSFTGTFRGARLSPDAERKVSRVCALSRAHPHGPLRLQVAAKGDNQRARRAHVVLQRWERAGCDGARLGTDAGTQPSAGDLSFTWLAY